MTKVIKKTVVTILLLCTALACVCFAACGVKFKVNFIVDGTVYSAIDTSGAEVIEIPQNPTKDGYTFDGWYWDKDEWQKPFTANSLLDAPLSSDMSVYAKFTLNTINGVSFEDVETTYDGTEKTIAVSNLPDGASVVYDKANVYINAGEYIVTATISQENYEDLQLSATLKINKATYDMSTVVFENKTVTYDGESHSIFASNLPDGVSVVYENNGKANAGSYTVIAKFAGDNKNYEGIPNKTATLKISKATYDMNGVKFENKTITYNGESHSIVASNLPGGVSVAYENNGKVNAGSYTVIAKFAGDNKNYEAIPNKTATLTILNGALKGLSFESKSFTYDGFEKKIEVIGIPSDATVTYDKPNKQINAGEYTIKATIKKQNYSDVTLTATLTINKATYDMNGITFENRTVTYSGETYSIFAQNVPNGLSVSYLGNGKINADTYTVTAIFTDTTGNYVNPEKRTATLVINKANVTGVSFTDKTFTYNGNSHSIAITGKLPDGVSVTYENNDKINVGTYFVTASFKDNSGNYIVPDDMTAKLIIDKSTISGITFENKTYTYNGEKHSLAISGTLPDEITVSYVNNGKTNAGTYTVTATFACDMENYVVPDDMTATLTVKKAVYDMSSVSFENKTVTYDGKSHALSVVGALPKGVAVSYANNNQTNANQYTVVASFTGDAINYYTIDDMQAMLTINKATYDMSNVSFVGGRFIYEGTSKYIYVSGNLPDGVSVTYTNNGKINANTYTVTAKFAGDTTNYNKLSDWTASLIIDKATYDMSGVSFKNQTFTYDTTEKNVVVSGNVPYGVDVVYVGNGKTDVGTYTVTAKFSGDRNNYYLIDDMTATLKINKAVPYIKEVSCSQTLNMHSTVVLVADTEVKGTVKFDDGQTLSLGHKTYTWTFTPEDAHNYTNATGTVGLTVCALVSYYNDGALFSSQNIVLNNSAYVPEDIPTKNDKNGLRYTFSHWSIEENGTEYDFTNAITADLNLYAVYDSEEIVYAINYYDIKGVENANIKTYTVSTAHTLSSIEKEHYIFNGWADGNGKTVTKINKGTFGTLNLYAKWTPVEYAITYDLGYRGATNHTENQKTYNVEDSFSFENASYDEYHTFVGWYLEKNFINQKSTISVGESGAITLYAKWDFSGTFITTATELQKMAYNMAGVYELKNDIDLTNETWTAIGDSTNPFTGYFNGADYSIKGKTPFDKINGIVKNLNSDVAIGDVNNGTIAYCNGCGIVSYNNGEIKYCYSNGRVSYVNDKSRGCIYKYEGGLVAYNTGTIIYCYANANFKSYIASCAYKDGSKTNAEGYFGGLVGYSKTTIMYSYVNCNFKVNGEALSCKNSEKTYGSTCRIYVGGICAYGAVEYCYTTGVFTAECIRETTQGHSNASVYELSPDSRDDSFSTCQVSYVQTSGSGTLKGDTTMLNATSRNYVRDILGWDESIWILEDGKYPKLWFEVE